MSPAAHSKEGEEPNEEALVGRLRRFIDDSDLSFYRIASLIGTSGTLLSMWLARTAKPHTAELAEIESFLSLDSRRLTKPITLGPTIRAPEAGQPLRGKSGK
jgi:hypothetical protein